MKWIMTVALLMSVFAGMAQANKESNEIRREVFTMVEEMPLFPGGEDSLDKYLVMNIKYPRIAMDMGIEGRVITKFIVSETGKVEQVEVVRGVSKELDEEAIRVISAMPVFRPGKQNGKAVAVYMTIPVNFRISD
jgi:protein TonB